MSKGFSEEIGFYLKRHLTNIKFETSNTESTIIWFKIQDVVSHFACGFVTYIELCLFWNICMEAK